MVWLESPYISHESLSATISEAEGKSNRSPADLDSFFLELNQDSGISKSVQALESY
jgi:hypothetical protein